MSLRSLIGLLILMMTIGSSAARADDAPIVSPWRFDLGLGIEARWRREINPAFGEYVNAPQTFATVWYRRFAGSFEFGREPARTSSSGGLSIKTDATRFGAWGRYGYATWGAFTPYVSLGGGATWDRVQTRFLSNVDERRGSRRFVGLGAGVSVVPFRFVMMEAEARVTSEEAVKFPGVAFVLKVGTTF